MRRRNVLAGVAAGVVSTVASIATGIASQDPSSVDQSATSGASLRARAERRGLMFGSMVQKAYLDASPAYAAAILRDCSIVVPGVEAKWWATEPDDGSFDFAPFDRVAEFARQGGLRLRGHTLVWGIWNPPWVVPALRAGRAETVLARHIDAVVGRTRGQALSWDVVNEPADPRWPSGPEGLCRTPWWHALGPAYVGQAFHLAHAADPAALLFVNDDWLEYSVSSEKRAIYLRLIEGWLRDGVPIHGFGLEAHLRPDLALDVKAYRRFLADLAGLGLQIHVTELDVIDRDLPADIAERDRMVAETASRYLDVVLDERAVKAVLVWGLSDQFSDLDISADARRPDGLPTRGAPLDRDFQRKPLWHAIGNAFDNAPDRAAA